MQLHPHVVLELVLELAICTFGSYAVAWILVALRAKMDTINMSTGSTTTAEAATEAANDRQTTTRAKHATVRLLKIGERVGSDVAVPMIRGETPGDDTVSGKGGRAESGGPCYGYWQGSTPNSTTPTDPDSCKEAERKRGDVDDEKDDEDDETDNGDDEDDEKDDEEDEEDDEEDEEDDETDDEDDEKDDEDEDDDESTDIDGLGRSAVSTIPWDLEGGAKQSDAVDIANASHGKEADDLDRLGRPKKPSLNRAEAYAEEQAQWGWVFQNIIMQYTKEQHDDWWSNPTTREVATRQRARIYWEKWVFRHQGELINEGTYGVIYNIRHHDTGVEHGSVIKTMKVPETTDSYRRHSRALRDARDLIKEGCLMNILNRNCESVLACHTVIHHWDGLRVSLVVPRMDHSLHSWLHADRVGARRNLSTEQCFRLISDISGALTHLHRRTAYAHLDVKAGNILVRNLTPAARPEDADLRFYLHDFGAAQEICGAGPEAPHTYRENRYGTLWTWAPELLFRGSSGGVDMPLIPCHWSADVFALGITAMDALGCAGIAQADSCEERLRRLGEYGRWEACFADWMDMVDWDPSKRPSADKIRWRAGLLQRLCPRDEGERREERAALFAHAKRDERLFRELESHHVLVLEDFDGRDRRGMTPSGLWTWTSLLGQEGWEERRDEIRANNGWAWEQDN